MVILHPEYLIEKKRRKAVMLPIAEWERIIDELEELDDIRAISAKVCFVLLGLNV